MDWNTIIGSGVFSVIVSALVSKAVAERRIYVENITRERAKWRERIRRVIQEYPIATDSQKIKLEMEFVSRLNPYDSEDLKLLESLKNTDNNNREELAIRAALLLKHDWERAKNEAKSFFTRRINPTKRLSFDKYMELNQCRMDGNENKFKNEIKRLTEDDFWM